MDIFGNIIEILVYENVNGLVEVVISMKIGIWDVYVDVINYSVNCDFFSYCYSELVSLIIFQYCISGDERVILFEYFNSGFFDEYFDDEDMVEEVLEWFY